MRKPISVLVLALLLAVSSVALAEEAPAPASTENTQGVVNINTADASQLALLPRVGEKAAQRIIDYRTQHGPFKKATDLMQVKGFGAKTFERVAPYVSLSGATTLKTKIKSPRKPRATKPTPTAAD